MNLNSICKYTRFNIKLYYIMWPLAPSVIQVKFRRDNFSMKCRHVLDLTEVGTLDMMSCIGWTDSSDIYSGGSRYKSFRRAPPPNRTKFLRFYTCFH